MKRKARNLILLAISILSVRLTITVYASNDNLLLGVGNIKSLELMSKTECEEAMLEFLHAAVAHNKDYLFTNGSMFNVECYDEVENYIANNNINSNSFSDFVIDFTYPPNSSTGDTVIMFNVKVWYSNNSYNNLYMFEFHVNSAGDIYGFNVWVY